MATSTFRNKNKVRPKKSPAAKRQRIKVQKKRLVALGVPQDQVEKLQSNELRALLRHPKRIAKALETQA
ncbi:MAG: hypothetical protein ACOX9E_12515 [Lentisphaeria bacterium]|jgi:hypothetical protein